MHLAAKVFGYSRWLAWRAKNVGDMADYMLWLRERFGKVTPLQTRERLWERMAQSLGKEPVRGLEFGVARGYGTGWWLERLTDSRLRWDGFDRFTGLPRRWRNLDEGYFDAQGRPPTIDDRRVTWHVGDVEDNLNDLDLDRTIPFHLVVLFDFDIYEPSAAAWEYLRDSLRPGDVLYFDEAFDAEERWLLNQQVLPAGEFAFVGATTQALALLIREIYPR